jgi:hypothetical protein
MLEGMSLASGVGELRALYRGASFVFSAATKEAVAYRAISAEYAESTIAKGFYKSGAAGRLGNDGIYANTTVQGALKEFYFHNPNGKAAVFEVRYPVSQPLVINPPSGYFSQPLPFTQNYNILAAPSLRAEGTTNLLIREGAKVGNRIL